MLILVQAFAAVYWVSPTGNDLATGRSRSASWQTLTKVNSYAVSPGFQPGDRIQFKRGNTWIGTIIINNSGTNNNPITIAAWGEGEKPIISGFTTVTGWTDEGGGVYSKTLTVESAPKIVTINNVQFAKGRTPNSDRYNPSVSDFYHIDTVTGDSIIVDSECNAATTDWDGAEIVIRSNNYWDWIVGTISNHTTTSVKFVNTYHNTIAAGFGYFIQNDLRTLDQFGEWYYGSGKIYVYFGSETPADYTVKVSSKDKLIDVNTRDYITVKNLKLEGANSAAVTTNYSSSAYNLTVDNCDFDFNYTSIYGHNAPNMTVTNCNVLRSSDKAIYDHWNSDGAYIANNTIDSTSLVIGAFDGEYSTGSGCGIVTTYSKLALGGKSIIENNIITNNGHSGMSVSGDSMIIRNNYINLYGINRSDAGGIYHGSQDDHSNMVVDKNIVLYGYLSDQLSGLPAGTTNESQYQIYFDYYSQYYTVTNNVVAYGMGGIMIHGSNHVTVTGNTIYGCKNAIKIQELNGMTAPLRNAVIKHNYIVSDAATQKNMIWARSLTNDFSSFGVIDSNYYSTNIGIAAPFATLVDTWTETYRTIADWKTYATQDSHSYMTFNKGSGTLFDYNYGKTTKTVTLTGSYLKADSTEVTGSYTLQPQEGIVLFKDTVTTINIDSMYAHYPFNINVNDTIGTQNGTNSGAVLTTSPKPNGAYDFDNNTDYIYFPINTSALTNKSYSVAFWVKFDNLPSTTGILASLFTDTRSGPSFNFSISVSTANTVVVTTRNTTPSNFASNSATGAIASAGVWYRIIVNHPKVGQAAQIFINGALSGSTGSTVTGTDRASDWRFYLGPITGSAYMGDCQIGDLKIRNKWYTATEAEYDYNGGNGR